MNKYQCLNCFFSTDDLIRFSRHRVCHTHRELECNMNTKSVKYATRKRANSTSSLYSGDV